MATLINYIEIPVLDMTKAQAFYGDLFGWQFTDFGPGYASFDNAGIDGGFDLTDAIVGKGTRVILHSKTLEAAYEKVKAYGATITAEIYSFPGGRRFEFDDPFGNPLAVWSDPTK
ncbi:MAG: VOC family protein [Candidatus Promineifilaceae bacterium]